MSDEILIAGAGIGGLTAALTLHRAGLPVRIFEAVPKIEPRGLAAGYRWPQISIHRGALRMLLLETVIERVAGFSLRELNARPSLGDPATWRDPVNHSQVRSRSSGV
jgi:glycine/D-amino acid oxidase-like deaminating enzyme